jgi:hypothetical protein
MRRSLRTLWLLTVVLTHATSPIFTLREKVDTCTDILRVSITESTPPKSDENPLDPAMCKAKVLEVLKGPRNLKIVEFRFYSYGNASRDDVKGMKGMEFLVFLHQPQLSEPPAKELWVLEGVQGLRTISEGYKEYKRSSSGETTVETYSRSNYFALIRTLGNAANSTNK